MRRVWPKDYATNELTPKLDEMRQLLDHLKEPTDLNWVERSIRLGEAELAKREKRLQMRHAPDDSKPTSMFRHVGPVYTCTCGRDVVAGYPCPGEVEERQAV